MVIFDLESDGLLDDVTQIHCLVTYEPETGNTEVYNSQNNNTQVGIRKLQEAGAVIGHNIIGYDIPVLRKLYPWFNPSGQVIDTLVLSRIFHSNILDTDKRYTWDQMPLRLYGRHSLESYGYRLGCHKGDFGKTSDWKEWSQEMEDYCKLDVKLTYELWKHFQNKL